MRLKAQKSKPFGPKEHHINEKKKKKHIKKNGIDSNITKKRDQITETRAPSSNISRAGFLNESKKPK
jgi:hypothetical protein